MRPVSRFPCASFAEALNPPVAPTVNDNAKGETETLATGTGLTVMAAVPVTPSDVAEIVAVPRATAVATPDASTVTVPFALEDHVTTLPERALPAASLGVADRVRVVPTMTSAVAGET